MLRCIFCGLCEEACPKEAIFLTDRIIDSDYVRKSFIFGKDILADPIDKPIDVSVRETKETRNSKTHPEFAHNKLYPKSLRNNDGVFVYYS